MHKRILLLFLVLPLTLIGQNPLVTHLFTADPTARVFDGKLYLYPSCDQIPPEGIEAPRFCMPGYHAFSSDNLHTWKDHGWVLKENDVPWGTRDTYSMWAPDCIKKGNKYYYYYPAQPADGSSFRRIGVGVSKSPTGPFKWEKSYIEGVDGIDPGLFIDDDERNYLYFGGGKELYGIELKDNMKEVIGKRVKLEGLPSGYKEGSFMFKKDDTYFFTFAHVFPQEGYSIGYATSDNPLGPFQYRGKIMDNIDNGTNHHSVVNYKGQWILFYHSWDLSGFNKLRSMRADFIEWHKDGSMLKVKPTLRGIGTPDIGDTIHVDRYNAKSNVEVQFVNGNEPDGWMVCETKTNGYVQYNRVNFGEGGAKKVQFRYASGQRVGSIEIRMGNPKGKLLAKYKIKSTYGWNNWSTAEVDLFEDVKGVQNLYVVFNGDGEWNLSKIANLNWIKFDK